MVAVSTSPRLSSDALSLFHATDHALSDTHVLAFYGPCSSSATGAPRSSHIQCHIITAAGLQTYSRVAISPNSPLYAAVKCLSREEQGDHTCQALAYTLYKYFLELSEDIKIEWTRRSLSSGGPSSANLFTAQHAAELASRMAQLPNSADIASTLENALAHQTISGLDVDIVLPSGAIDDNHQHAEDGSAQSRYGKFASIIELFGEPAFIPTSKIQRAPSRHTSKRSASFARAQKEALRRELVELVDTEENYVCKIDEMVNDVAMIFRREIYSKSIATREAISKLFPKSLDQVLKVNTTFLQAARAILEETESKAIDDIVSTPKDASKYTPQKDHDDPTGAYNMSSCMVNHFPNFIGCYQDYFSAQTGFQHHLKTSTSDVNSSIASKVHEIGDQRLMSMLIEPIQRLPRYSLYIENIAKQLPSHHPALQNLMKAKDIITDICADDKAFSSNPRSIARLRDIVQSWPSNHHPTGRFITAVDMIRLKPPFRLFDGLDDAESVVGILTAGSLALFRSTSPISTSARTLQTELENPRLDRKDLGQFENQRLTCVACFPLESLKVFELADDAVLKIVPPYPQADSKSKSDHESILSAHATATHYRLGGVYERRASKFVKDLARARLESRFTNAVREGPKWEAREFEDRNLGLSIYSAVTEQTVVQKMTKQERPTYTRIVLQDQKGEQTIGHTQTLHTGILASISIEGQGFYRLEVESAGRHKVRDLATSAQLVPLLTKRISNILLLQNSTGNGFIRQMIQYHESILLSLDLPTQRRTRSQSKTLGLRQRSPVKTLSKLFPSNSQKELTDSKQPLAGSHQSVNYPPPLRPRLTPRSGSQQLLDITNKQHASQITLVSDDVKAISPNSIDSLEQIFANYVLALHARKGNVVARSISGRCNADEALVNELYRALLEQPEDHERAAQAPVDALFAAFEKFLKFAWQERLGPLATRGQLGELYQKSETLSPIDFEDYILNFLSDLAPQNRRAFRRIIALLVDLLDGMGNDGDRGALTAAMSEILVPWERSQRFMPLFDRLVAESDVILQSESRSGAVTPVNGSIASSTAARSINTGSLSSKASSLSKRLGFGSLNRDGGGGEPARMGSVLKTWGKSTRAPDCQSRGNLSRTQSVEWHCRAAQGSRPNSSDKPNTPDGSQSSSRPGTGRSWDQLDTLKEAAISEYQTPQRKKKRRSSLSDIDSLPLPNTSPFWGGTPTLRRTNDNPPFGLRVNTNACQSTPMTSPSSPASPTRSNAVRSKSPPKKENLPPTLSAVNATAERPSSSDSNGASYSTRFIPDQTSLSSQDQSAIPVPKGVLSERAASGNTPQVPQPAPQQRKSLQQPSASDRKPTATPTSSPTKKNPMRPTPAPSHKFEDRLRTQNTAIETAQSSLQAELAKIGEELSGLNIKTASPTRSNTTASAPPHHSSSPSKRDTRQQESQVTQNLSTRLRGLETRVQHLTSNLSRHNTEIEKELKGALKVSERKSKEMEGLLRDVQRENAALYQRNNEELAKVFERVEGGEGAAELKRKLGEVGEEASRWKREIARLRRENASLKAGLEGR